MEPYGLGKMSGYIFWGLILAWGIIKCNQISKRETTCKKCVSGLMLTLMGLTVLYLFAILRAVHLELTGFFVLLIIAWLILLISGSVVAIIGLVEYKQNPGYTQGRGQAITAIVLSVIVLAVAGFGFYQGFINRSLMISPLSRAKLPQQDPGTLREFKDLNFKYKIPAKPWVELDAKKINPYAVLALMNGRLNTLFMIIAEEGGLDFGLDSAALAEVSRANLKSHAKNATFTPEKTYTVNGLPGLRFNGNARVLNQNFTYVYWVCSHNGYYYQLITFGEAAKKQRVHQEAERLLKNFEQLDKNKVLYSDPSQSFATFTSKHFNYTVDLENTSWKKWDSLDKDMPGAETGAILSDETWFSVVPFYYGKESPSLDTLTSILLDFVSFQFPGKHIKDLTGIKEAGMKGHRFITHDNVDGRDYVFYNKVLQGKECGYLVIFGTPQDNPQAKTLAKQVSDAVQFHPQQPSSLDLAKLPGRLQVNHALYYNELGVFYCDTKQFHKSLQPFKIAFELKPEDQAIFENLLLAYMSLEKYNEGLAAIKNLQTLPKDNKEIRAWKATFLAKLNRSPEAIAIFRQLFAENHKNDDDFGFYIDLLTQQQQWDQADAAYKAYLRNNDSLRVRLDYAYLFYQQGKYDESIKMLKDQQRQVSFNAEIAYALIRNYDALGQYKEGLEVCQQLIDKGFASKDAYNEKGSLEYQLKWYRKAKESFEKALSYAPNDTGIQEDLKYISGLLGEGDNTILKDAIAEVSLPEVVKAKLPPLTAPSPEKGCSAYYISKVQGIRFLAEKGTTFTRYETIKILDSGGVSRFSTLEFDFSPLSEKIFVNRLIVRDPEGNVVSKGKPSDYYVVDKQESEMATHDQTLNIPVPNLQPGYIIQLTWTLERPGDKKGFSFYSSSLAGLYPAVFSARYLTGDVEGLVHLSANGVEELSFEGGKLWYMNHPPVYQWEPRPVHYTRFLPMVWLNDASPTWESEGKKYLEDIREKTAVEPQVSKLAQELTTGMTSDQEKINALARYLQKTYTYKALEFGKRARLPNKGSQIIANKYGDCKDHALLFHQLLKALDIPSYLALVNLEQDIKSQLPSLDQFNHMILYIPGNGSGGENSGRFIDTTDKGLDLRLPVPSNLGGKQALVLNPRQIRLLKIPPYEPQSSKVIVQKDIRMVNSKEMRVQEKVTITGYYASLMREYLKIYETSKQSQWAHRFISAYLDSCELKTVEIKNLYDNWQPLLLEFDYTVTEQSRTPNVWESYYLEVTSVKERKTPFKIYYPFIMDSQCTVKAPSGYTLEVKSGYRPQKKQHTMVQWESQVRIERRQVDLRLQCTLKPGEYDAGQYPYFRSMMNKAIKAMAVELSCKK